MGRQNEMSTFAYVKTICKFVSGCFEFFCLSHEKIGSNNAPVADDIDFVLTENA